MRTSQLPEFALIEGERNIPIDKTQHNFRFSKKWFKTRNQPTWSTFFPQKYSHNQPINMIQIGVFEGMDLVWCLQNILGHPDSSVIAIDPWSSSGMKQDQEKMDKVYDNAKHNLMPWSSKVLIRRGSSAEILPKLKSIKYNLLVIDGCHDAEPVYQDACDCLRLAASGAWMVFDDVRNSSRKKMPHVQQGIDKFLKHHNDKVQLAWKHRFCNCYEVL